MQIKAIKLKDLICEASNELQLCRSSFVTKTTSLISSYFCLSTEDRFILRTGDYDDKFLTLKERQAEYWHAKSLEIACTFLPADCLLT
jgi:hypothetical protein